MNSQVLSLSFDIPTAALQGPEAAMGPMVKAAAGLWKAGETQQVVIEVFELQGRVALLVSLAAPGHARQGSASLTCWYAFAQDSATCDALQRMGIPAIEAAVTWAGGVIMLGCAFYPGGEGDSLSRWGELLRIEELPDAAGSAAAADAEQDMWVTYRQQMQSPDPGHSLQRVVVLPRAVQTRRCGRLLGGKRMHALAVVADARFPDVGRLIGGVEAGDVWRGQLFEGGRARSRDVPHLSDRKDLFGPPSFRFRGVEIIGFRIDLKAPADPGKDPLDHFVQPLNFHLDERHASTAPVDFRYRPAARSVVVELLRYERMMGTEASGSLRADDAMSQHELLTRVLVGRFDDGATQARDPAVYAPVLFVDNAWSKAFGRELQGYDKQLAAFCHGPGETFETLSMQGESAQGLKIPLHDVSRVALPDKVADAGWAGGQLTTEARQALAAGTLFEMRLQEQAAGDDEFRPANLAWLGGVPGLGGLPWRQSDFIDTEFRRSFARDVLSSRFSEFRSIQVVPVAAEESGGSGLPPSWVQGRFTLLRPRFASGAGLARLRFVAPAHSPQRWQAFVALLEGAGVLDPDDKGQEGWLAVAPGDWYRVRCDIDLLIDDGLAF